jgi:anti-sigma-K factor RskA
MSARGRKDLATNTGAYVLNALDADERNDLEAQLADSEQARHEVTELTDTAVLLGLAVRPVEPSAALKERLMGRIATTPQLSKVIPPVAALVPGSPGGAHLGGPSTSASDTARSRWFTRPVIALTAVAAAVALIVGGGVVANIVQNSGDQTHQANELAQITNAPDATSAESPVSTGGTAKLVWAASVGKSMLTMTGVATLPSDKTYELWYIDATGAATPAGLLDINGDSDWRVLDGTMHAGDTVGVTIEPRGGSGAPTTKPVVAIASA